MNTALLRQKIEDARQRLTVAERELESAMTTLIGGQGGEKTLVAKQLDGAFGKLREAKRHLTDLTDLLDGDGPSGEPAPSTRECPECKKTIMAAATLCGYCWRKLA